MFGKVIATALLMAAMLFAADVTMADSFGTGGNVFTIDFVSISGDTNPSDGYGIVNHDYRIGTCEITNSQWNNFKVAYGTPTGADGGYSSNTSFTAQNVPTDSVSWYEAAQFVNWLNTSTGNQAAYKFTGTRGTSNYRFSAWSLTDIGYDAGNPYRNKAAKYYLPTENEWVKAAYWNGTMLQPYATKVGEGLTQGNGTSKSGWNYYTTHFATNPLGPWNVGSGSQELNGTYDMMGNVWEWMENPWANGDYSASAAHGLRGGSWGGIASGLVASYRLNSSPSIEDNYIGFRVASIPEPCSLAMLLGIALTALLSSWRKHA